ncbi:MAG: TRAP transporter large permease [Actinobacteria bacterium]|nr:TRAP transporter large permease [Actinomycetota bacterium]
MPVMSLSVVSLSFLLLFLGIPIGVSLGFSSLIVLAVFHPVPLAVVPQMLWGGTETFILIAVPFFVLTGIIMELGGVSDKLINFTNSLFGWMKGGLGAVNIVSSFIFGGISGSSLADTVAIGSIMIPKMIENDYGKEYSAAITAVSSTLSVIVPPSILMVVLGVVAGQSVGRLLVGGIVPGALLTFIMLIQNYFISKKRDYGQHIDFSLKNIWTQTKKGIFPLGTPFIILGGIMTGLITPTEASGVAVLYTLFIIKYILVKKDFYNIFVRASIRAADITSSIIFIVVASKIFTFIITFERLPWLVSSAILQITTNPLGVLLVVSVFLLIVGMFIDSIVTIIICAPILFPVAIKVGIDPIHFGVFFVFCLAIGLVTPPFGVCLFSVCNIAKMKMESLTKAVFPLYFSLLLTLLFVILFPQIVLLLPNAFLK